MIAPAFILSAAGGIIFRQYNKQHALIKNPNRDLVFQISLFAIFVTLGSLAARFIFSIENTFLTLGLYTLMVPLTYWFVKKSANPLGLVKAVFWIYLFWAIVALIMQIIYYGKAEIFHSREYLVVAVLSGLYFLAKSSFSRFLVILVIVFSAFVGHKNTAYLTAMLAIIYISMIWALPYAKGIKDSYLRVMFWGKLLILSTLLVAVIGFVYFYIKSDLPTGNPEYRLHTYEKAWDKFIQSPLWGTGFTGAASEKFDLFTVGISQQTLPTHSDPLDILANGGLIGFALWAVFFTRIYIRWYRFVLAPEPHVDAEIRPYLHSFFCITAAGILVCTFNPILNSPNLAWSLWNIVGVLLAVFGAATPSEKKTIV